MFAQVINPDAPEVIQAVVGTWQPVVAALAPILLGMITSEDTRKQIKTGLPVVFAGVLGVISVLAEDGMTWEGLIFQVPALWLVIESSFRALSTVVSAFARADVNLNDVLRPQAGLIK